MDKIVLVTGGFDPIHSGHISLLKESNKIGKVVVGLNSDQWLSNKKGMPFQTFEERYEILSNLKDVQQVIKFDDSDGTAIDAIRQVLQLFPNSEIIFSNGGDRTSKNIPELDFCIKNNVETKFEVGGNYKKNSSSWLLSNWNLKNKEQRLWGLFKTLYTNKNIIKVKELTIEPGKGISLQLHKNRTEHWFIISGKGILKTGENYKCLDTKTLAENESVSIPPLQWHSLTNLENTPLILVEVQFGSNCNESDIQRII